MLCDKKKNINITLKVTGGGNIAQLYGAQWRIQSWSQGGFPKVANLSGW